MNNKELQKERVRLFRDAANFKKTERITLFRQIGSSVLQFVHHKRKMPAVLMPGVDVDGPLTAEE